MKTEKISNECVCVWCFDGWIFSITLPASFEAGALTSTSASGTSSLAGLLRVSFLLVGLEVGMGESCKITAS